MSSTSITAAPMMRAINAALESARYEAQSRATDKFLETLHEAGYEIVRTIADHSTPFSYVAQAYPASRYTAPTLGESV